MMNYEEFKEELRNEIANIVVGEVNVVTVPKNNGIQLEALSVRCKDSNVTPLIYLNDYYNELIGLGKIEQISMF